MAIHFLKNLFSKKKNNSSEGSLSKRRQMQDKPSAEAHVRESSHQAKGTGSFRQRDENDRGNSPSRPPRRRKKSQRFSSGQRESTSHTDAQDHDGYLKGGEKPSSGERTQKSGQRRKRGDDQRTRVGGSRSGTETETIAGSSSRGSGRSQRGNKSPRKEHSARGDRAPQKKREEPLDRISQIAQSRIDEYDQASMRSPEGDGVKRGSRAKQGERGPRGDRDQAGQRDPAARGDRPKRGNRTKSGERRPREDRDQAGQREPAARGDRPKRGNRTKSGNRRPREDKDQEWQIDPKAQEERTEQEDRIARENLLGLSPVEEQDSDEGSPADSILDTSKIFEDLGVTHPHILAKLKQQKMAHPTEVQSKSIPMVMDGKNVVCSSFTGSGKTLAFVLPILSKLVSNEIDQVVILSPTREIAMQTQKVISAFLPYEGITCGLVVGGLDMNEQRRILREYPKIFIATPGRLVHAIKEGKIWLKYTNMVVLDEIDRMLDMGFKDQIDLIYEQFPRRKKDPASPETKSMQILAFTATLMPSIQNAIDEGIPEYEKIVIGDGVNVNKNIDHKVFQVNGPDKWDMLKRILQELDGRKTIVFFNTIEDTIRLSGKARRVFPHRVLALHSRKSQEERNSALNAFRTGKAWLMFATDVASRGIDVYRIEHVINFNVPRHSEEYIHRLGRTGRMSLRGHAITLMEKRELRHLQNIEKLLKTRIPIVEHSSLA